MLRPHAETPCYFPKIWIIPAIIIYRTLLKQYTTKKTVDVYRVRKRKNTASQLFYR